MTLAVITSKLRERERERERETWGKKLQKFSFPHSPLILIESSTSAAAAAVQQICMEMHGTASLMHEVEGRGREKERVSILAAISSQSIEINSLAIRERLCAHCQFHLKVQQFVLF